MPDSLPPVGPDAIEQAVRQVLGSLSGDLTANEAALLTELEGLGAEVARAKSEIAALRVDEINESQIPRATDELDAVVEHTAAATNEILDVCDVLEGLQNKVAPEQAEALATAVTRIYEACSFQDITGQRIGKVVAALKAIEARVAMVTARFDASGRTSPLPAAPAAAVTEGRALANGPQLPGAASSQEEIDKLLASFD
jgi:chemotaxis protein CheZ